MKLRDRAPRKSFAILLTFAGLSACAFDLTPDDETRITCVLPGDCPKLWSCVEHVCVAPGKAVPQQTIAFVAPPDHEPNATVTPDIIIAFSQDASLETLIAELIAPGGRTIPLVPTPTQLATTFRFEPVTLEAQTDYVLHVFAGVASTSGLGLASDDFTSTFHTGDAPDHMPPATVSGLVVERVADARVKLTWTNPSDSDRAGALIVRKANGVVSERPLNGTTYAIGTALGPGAVVIASIDGTEWDDVTVGTTPSDYAVFAFDRASNYAAPVRAPFVTDFSIDWCPSETGTIHALSPDQGSYSLLVSTAAQPMSADTLPGAKLGEDTAFTVAAPFTLGAEHFVRLVAVGTGGANGTSIGAVRSFWTSKQSLAPVAITPDVRAVNGPVELTFTHFGWTTFAAEIDDQPLTGPPGTTGVHFVSVPGGLPTATPLFAGEYYMRVKPVVAGCADAAWTQSAPFSVGSARFVRPGGSGDGSSPSAATGSIAGALASAPNGADIFVALGTYAESVTVAPGRRIFGGFDATFVTRNPAANVTTITATPTSGSAVVTIQGVVAAAVPVVDGFTIDARGTGNVEHAALAMNTTAIVENNVLYAGGLDADQGVAGNEPAVALRADNAHDGFIRNNTVRATAWASAGLLVLASLDLTIERNDISAMIGLDVQSGDVLIRNNEISCPSDARTHDRAGISMAGAGTIEDNLVSGGDGNTPAYTVGLYLGSNFDVTVRRNRISGGRGLAGARGLYFASTGTAFVANNLISAGHATTGRRLAVDSAAGTGGRLFLTNNTLHTGTGSTTIGIGLELGAPGLVATNNLVFGSNTWTFAHESGFANGDPSSLDHNVILATPVDLYENDYETSGSNPAATTVQGMQDLLWCQLIPAENNVLAGGLDPSEVFTDVDGADDDIDTIADNDWSLLAGTSATVRFGGVGPSGPSGGCGARDPASSSTMLSGCPAPARLGPCHLPATDFANVARSAPWSVGAYERD